MAFDGDRGRARNSHEVIRSSLRDLHGRQRRRSRLRTLLTLALLAVIVWGANDFLAGQPVEQTLAGNPAFGGIALQGHLRYYVDPTTLVLDLKAVSATDTTDALRAALAVCRQLLLPDLVSRVVLARGGTPVFTVDGATYRRLALNPGNPVLALRSLAAALVAAGGGPASADPAQAARLWAGGGR